jgi:hypothetical protein
MRRSRSGVAASMTCSSSSASATSLSASRGTHGDQRVRQAIDESDRVRDEKLAAIRQRDAADEGIQRHEERVRRGRVTAGQGVEQRRLAGVRVADERDGRHGGLVTALAQLRPAPADRVDFLREDADAVADAPAIGFQFGLAGTERADPAARPRQRVARADEPRHEVLELRELDLQLAFAGARAPREDIENELRAVDHPPIERRFEVAQLRGATARCRR